MTPRWFTRDIYPGDSGRDVASLQAALGIPQTGVLDDYTEAYVRGIERLMGKKKTEGVVDAKVASKVGDRARTKAGKAPSWFEHDAGKGHYCACVQSLRQILEVPHNGSKDFDERLEAAVKRFQSGARIKVTGVVDKDTAVALGE